MYNLFKLKKTIAVPAGTGTAKTKKFPDPVTVQAEVNRKRKSQVTPIFPGREPLKSSHNVQLCDVRASDQGDVYCQCGKVFPELFFLDYKHPLSALQVRRISFVEVIRSI